MEFSRHACWSGQAFPSPGVFPTQGSDPALVPHPLHCRQVLYHVSHQGSFPVMVCLDRLLIFIWLTCAVPYSSAYSLCFSSFVSCFLPFCVSSFLPFPQSCPTLCDPMDSTVHGISRPECWSGSLFLLQGTFPTHRSNPSLLHCRQTLHQVGHKGSPSLPPLSILLSLRFIYLLYF